MSTAIEFSHVSKQYRLGLVSTKTLSHDIRRFWITNVLGKEDPYLKIGETNDRASKGNSEYVWALRDIDFLLFVSHNMANRQTQPFLQAA